MQSVIHWYYNEKDFDDEINGMIQKALDDEMVIPLPVKATIETAVLVLSMVDCSRCDQLCCRSSSAGSEVDLTAREHKRLTDKYGNDGISETGITYPCRFLLGGKCIIYDERPFVCQLYPLQHGARGFQDGMTSEILGLDSACPEAGRIAKVVYKSYWHMSRMREEALMDAITHSIFEPAPSLTSRILDILR